MRAGVISILLLWFFLSPDAMAQDLSVNLLNFTNANTADKGRVHEALRLLGKVANSQQFQNQILNMSYTIGEDSFSGFTQTDLSPEEILRSIQDAVENFDGGSVGSVDLYLDMYYEKCTPLKCVVGYTSKSDPYIHMNRYLHQDYTPAETAGNIFHEWLHKLGHGHSQKNNPERPHSVPYKLGYLLAKMTAQIASGGDPLKEAQIEERMNLLLNQSCAHAR